MEALSWVMPPLNGQMLEPPRYHAVTWKDGQIFHASQDPDRVLEPWTAPDFIWKKDPAKQQARTTCKDLPIYNRIPGRRFAKFVSRVMEEEDCAALLQAVNKKAFTPALVNVGCDRQVLRPEVRDGHRVIVDSTDLAAWLLEVIRPHLPRELEGFSLIDLNERCRFLCYTPGQCFEEHMDGCFRRQDGHPHSGSHSRVTIQLYLHDVPRAHGGATTFFPGRRHEVSIQPKAGSVLLFTQDLMHEGSLLQSGLKYTMRTEAMYAPATSSGSFESDP